MPRTEQELTHALETARKRYQAALVDLRLAEQRGLSTNDVRAFAAASAEYEGALKAYSEHVQNRSEPAPGGTNAGAP